jgi:hypothetical protein
MPDGTFIVLRIATPSEYVWSADEAVKNTAHIVIRQSRVKAYDDLYLLNTNFKAGFAVDKGHKDGIELHMINDNGIIYVYNIWTRRLITMLGARVGQIKRYYTLSGKEIPEDVKEIIAKASKNIKNNGINNL